MRKSFTLLAALVATSFANDARMNALGNSEMFGDAQNMLINPAYVSQYKIIEGNITGMPNTTEEYVASGIATWHINDNIMLGGYYNENESRASLFNTATIDTLTGDNLNGGYAFPARKTVPHLLFGVKLGDKVALGLDGSFEGSKNISVKTKSRTTVIGAKLGLLVETDLIDIDVSGGTYLPSSQATVQIPTGTGTDTKDTVCHDTRGIGIMADARVTIKFDEDFSLKTGISFDIENAKDKKADKPKDPKESAIGLMVGVAKSFENDMTLGLSSMFGTTKQSWTNTEDVDAAKFALFTASAEKNFGETKLFDTHSFRIGYSHAFVRGSEVVDNGVDANDKKIPSTENKTSGQWLDIASDSSDIGLTLGTGMTRGKFGLDLYVSSGDFNFADNTAGILGLMPVAGATLTMDFAKESTKLRAKD